MKNSKLVKVILMISIALMVVSVAVDVFAADSDNYNDLGSIVNSTGNNTSSGNTSSGNSTGNTAGNNTARTNTATTNTSRNTSLNTSAITNNATPVSNTALPQTGIGSSTSIIVLITIFGISSIYAYKKVREYKSL